VDAVEKVLPPDIPTLAQILWNEGYHTVGLVNDGQMQAHWGFDRGFDVWREFSATGPEGTATTSRTRRWHGWPRAPPQALFSFPALLRRALPLSVPAGVRCDNGLVALGPAGRCAAPAASLPGESIDPATLAQLEGSYDGAIAWMDSQLGRILPLLPRDAIVVIFSDHGRRSRSTAG